MEDLELEIIDDLGDVEEEDSVFTYEVWVLGYDENMDATDFEYDIDTDYTDVKEARKCFDFFAEGNRVVDFLKAKNVEIDADTKHIHLFLEECLDGGCQDILKEVEIF